MARVMVVHGTRPDLYAELGEDDDASWDGPCTGCDLTPGEGGTRHNGLEDAVQASIVHLDHHH